MFLLGTHQVHWLAQTSVPLFISRARLVGRKSFPRARGLWCLDSSGFSQLQQHGTWPFDDQQYAAEARIYAQEIGNLRWAAPRDWMCERVMLRKTGKTIRQHQELTTRSVLELRSIAPEIPWIPVLQGWAKDDYLDHIELYARAGIDLVAEQIVGLGSVCRRQGSAEFIAIVRALTACGLTLHGFGVKTLGLKQVASLLGSSDSMAWSIEARWLQKPGLEQCIGGKHKNCANCLPYALSWRAGLLKSLPSTWQ